MAAALDHIIILVPHATLSALPASLISAFQVVHGGQHADGLTENKLVVFADGVYLELIAFLPGAMETPEGQAHWWGRKKAGVIDFALTHPSLPSSFPPAYDSPQAGGRVRPDGKKIEWVVTFPEPTFERGALPFFCHDKTPRELRVPLDADKTAHPSGAVGVAGLTVRVPEKAWEGALPVYEQVFGAKGVVEGEAMVFEVQAVTGDEKAQVRLVKGEGAEVSFDEVVVRTAKEDKPAPLEEEFQGRPFRVRFV